MFFENRMDHTLAYTSCFVHKMGNVLNLFCMKRTLLSLNGLCGGLKQLTESTLRRPTILGVCVVSSVTVLCMSYRSIRWHINRSVCCWIGCLMEWSSVARYRSHIRVRWCWMKHYLFCGWWQLRLWRWLMDFKPAIDMQMRKREKSVCGFNWKHSN